MDSSSAPSKSIPALRPRPLVRWLAVAIVLAGSLSLAEVGVRLTMKSKLRKPPADERSLTYDFDSQLGWFPAPNSRRVFRGGNSQEVVMQCPLNFVSPAAIESTAELVSSRLEPKD